MRRIVTPSGSIKLRSPTLRYQLALVPRPGANALVLTTPLAVIVGPSRSRVKSHAHIVKKDAQQKKRRPPERFPDMKVLLSAADSGALKSVEFSRAVDTSNPDSEQPNIEYVVPGPRSSKKALAVTHVCNLGHITVIARKNGQVLIDQTLLHDFSAAVVGLNGAVVPVGRGSTKQKRRHALVATAVNGDSRLIILDNDGAVISSIEFKLREELSAVVNDPSSSLTFASAGPNALPDVFKLDVSEDSVRVKPVWSAEPLPNDHLDLPVPNLVSALAFVDQTRLVATTSRGILRVYDIGHDTQPISTAPVSKYGLNCLVADASHPGTIIVGDSNTLVSRWSVEPLKLLGTYKGVIGSTRALSIRGDYVAMGGLDRYLRVFHITKRQLSGKVYIGDEIWALELVRTDDEESMSDLDNMWDELDSKRRKLASNDYEEGSDVESPFEGFDD